MIILLLIQILEHISRHVQFKDRFIFLPFLMQECYAGASMCFYVYSFTGSWYANY